MLKDFDKLESIESNLKNKIPDIQINCYHLN